MRIQFVVPCVPVAQPRQRHALIAGHVRNYTPCRHPVNDFKATVRMAWIDAIRSGKLTYGVFGQWDASAPISITIRAVFPRPKSKTTKRGPNNRDWKPTKPDWDNIGKAVCDALNGLAYDDDSQIVEALVYKFIAAADEQPHVTVAISTLTGKDSNVGTDTETRRGDSD